MKRMTLCVLCAFCFFAAAVSYGQAGATAAGKQAVLVSQADLDKIAAKSNEEMEAYLAAITEDETVALFKAVCDGKHRSLETRLLVALQNVLNKMDPTKAKSLAERLSSEVPGMNFSVSPNGTVTVFTIPSIKADDGVNFKVHSKKLSKGATVN